MLLRLLWRFHLHPWLISWAAAFRRGPGVMGVAIFLIAVLLSLTLSGKPILVLPPGGGQAALFGALVLLGALLIWGAGQGGAERWRFFFQARPRGSTMWGAYLAARSLGAWLASTALVAALGGPDPWLMAGTVLAAPVFAAAMAWVGSRPPRPTQSRRTPRLPSLSAWWLSRPVLFLVPPLAWLALLAWVASGNAGFVWAERPPVAQLLLDFGWPTLVGLLWSEAAGQLPWSYFRMARAPFRRVFAVVAGPLAGATVLAVIAGALVAWSATDALRAAVLMTTGTAFWVAFWLRWGPANLAHLMLFATLFLTGVTLEPDWWALWAVLQSLGALAATLAWRVRYYEGEIDVGA